MNTLSKQITSKFFVNSDSYRNLIQHWKTICKTPMPASSHLFYSLVRGRDYRKGFGPITNSHKLAHGMHQFDGMFNAFEELHFKGIPQEFSEFVNEQEFWAAMEVFLPKILTSSAKPEEAYV